MKAPRPVLDFRQPPGRRRERKFQKSRGGEFRRKMKGRKKLCLVTWDLPAYVFLKPSICVCSLANNVAPSFPIRASSLEGRNRSPVPSEQGCQLYCKKRQ